MNCIEIPLSQASLYTDTCNFKMHYFCKVHKLTVSITKKSILNYTFLLLPFFSSVLEGIHAGTSLSRLSQVSSDVNYLQTALLTFTPCYHSLSCVCSSFLPYCLTFKPWLLPTSQCLHFIFYLRFFLWDAYRSHPCSHTQILSHSLPAPCCISLCHLHLGECCVTYMHLTTRLIISIAFKRTCSPTFILSRTGSATLAESIFHSECEIPEVILCDC